MAAGVGLAGCNSDGSGDGDSGDDGDSGGDPTESAEDTVSTDDSGNGSGEDSTTTESGGDGQTSGRQFPGEVSNDLTGFEVLDHSAEVSEDGFSGSVTLRNVGNETAELLEHAIDFELFDDDGSILTGIESWSGEKRELAPEEEGVMEFFDEPAVDADLSQAESYELVLTYGSFETGVYCP